MAFQLFLIIYIVCIIIFPNSFTFGETRCGSGQFQCAKGSCIPATWRCDGNIDCTNGADELGCASKCPYPDAYFCESNNKCIKKEFMCDGTPDCPLEDDESEKTCFKRKCLPTEFACRFKRGSCVPNAALCNRVNDCKDSSDESSEVCIAKYRSTNGSSSVTGRNPCGKDEFHCVKSRTCISSLYQCDGSNDCEDGSDEKSCARACRPDEFSCTSPRQCLPGSARCDARVDCTDGSDEAGCVSETKSNPCVHATDFHCGVGAAGACIDAKWVCDGSFDCINGHDEINCPPPACKPGQFRCNASNHCLEPGLRCDRINQCSDGSDEEGCPYKNRTVSKICNPLTEFDCSGDGSRCIPLALVCDGNNDCGRFEDERPGGKPANCDRNLCTEELNGGCSQLCTNRYSTAVCSCRPGYALMSDQRTCDDVNECEAQSTNPYHHRALPCSHICINTKGGFKCSCHPGYTPRLADTTRCAATGEKFLLFSAGGSVRELRLLRNHLRQVIGPGLVANSQMTIQPIDIDYDYHAQPQTIYWSQTVPNAGIFMAPLGGSNEGAKLHIRQLVTDRISEPDGLAVDWVHNLLFWTDATLKEISVLNLTAADSSNRRVLARTGAETKPRAIVVDPRQAMVYWNDWGRNPKIESIGMNGQGREVLVDTDIETPNGLALDHIAYQLYWGDARLGLISCIDLQTRRRRVVLSNLMYYPFSLGVFEDKVYWSDWRLEGIFMTDKYTGGDVTQVIKARKPLGLRLFHEVQQPRPDFNFCAGHLCSHLCLPVPPRLVHSAAASLSLSQSAPRYSCGCPDGWNLLPDGMTCNMSSIGNSINTLETLSPNTTTTSAKPSLQHRQKSDVVVRASLSSGQNRQQDDNLLWLRLTSTTAVVATILVSLIGALIGHGLYRTYRRHIASGRYVDGRHSEAVDLSISPLVALIRQGHTKVRICLPEEGEEMKESMTEQRLIA